MAYKPVFIALLVALVVLLLYGNAASAPFLFDSKVALDGNPTMQIDGAIFDEWRGAALSSNSGPLGRPLSMLSLAASHVLAGGLDPFQFRLFNIVLHLALAVLLFLLVRQLWRIAPALEAQRHRADWIAFLAATIWVLHPLQVSTVLYTVQRMAQLAALFTFLGVLLYLHYRERWLKASPTVAELIAAAYWLALLTLLAGLSKENGLLLPCLLAAIEVSLFQFVVAGRQQRLLGVCACLLCLLPLLIATGVLIAAPEWIANNYSGREFTVQERLLSQLRMLWHYVSWLILPDIRAMGLHHDDLVVSTGWLQPVTTLLAAVGWLTLLSFAIWRKRQLPVLLFAVLWFLLGHSMESTIVPLEMVYEHRNYVPGIAVCLFMSWAIVVLCERVREIQLPVIAALVLVLLAGFLWLRTDSWSDEWSLARAQVAHHPDSALSNYHIANTALRRSHLVPEAERDQYLSLSHHYYERMQQIDPGSFVALISLFYLDSLYFSGLDDPDWFSLLEQSSRERRLSPADYNALNLWIDCMEADICAVEKQRVLRLFDELSARVPHRTGLWDKRARYLALVEGDYPAAIMASKRAIGLDPDNPAYYFSLIAWYAGSGQHGQAMETSRQLLVVDGARRHVARVKQMFQQVE